MMMILLRGRRSLLSKISSSSLSTNTTTTNNNNNNNIINDSTYAISGCDISDELTGAIVPPLYFSTTYERDKETLQLSKGFNYSRLSNPTRLLLEKTFTKLENGIEGYAFSSGMQAVLSILQSCPKCHLLLPDDLYHGVYVIALEVLKPWGLTFEKIDMTNHILVEKKLIERKSYSGQQKTIVWLETPSNPQCKVTDISYISKLAKKILNKEEDVCIVVDATWSTPYLLRPLDLDADFSLHSTTKYVGGHSDILGGLIVAGNTNNAKSILPSLRIVHQIGGGVCGPFESWMLLRGLRTLPVRMKAHCDNALALASFLNKHPNVEKVFYPGLSSHPQHELAKNQLGGRFGGMLSFLVKKGSESDGIAEACEVSIYHNHLICSSFHIIIYPMIIYYVNNL
jgi:cystathionine gamma-synthase